MNGEAATGRFPSSQDLSSEVQTRKRKVMAKPKKIKFVKSPTGVFRLANQVGDIVPVSKHLPKEKCEEMVDLGYAEWVDDAEEQKAAEEAAAAAAKAEEEKQKKLAAQKGNGSSEEEKAQKEAEEQKAAEEEEE